MICPEFFGCSGKLEFAETRKLVSRAGLDLVGDFSVSRGIAFSIDRISQCSRDPIAFSRIALAHACRDLEAGFVTPRDALICYEFGPDCTEEERLKLVRALKETADSRMVAIGKCHSSLIEGTTSVVICVAGETHVEPIDLPETGTVWLSHGLGAAKLQYMEEIGTLSEPSPHFTLMTSPINTGMLEHPKRLLSDVSGHGLAGTLVDLAERYNLAISVSISPSVAVAQLVLTEEIQLFQNDPNSYTQTLKLDERALRLATLKETAGPFVALTTASSNDTSLAALSEAGWLRIGEYEKGPVGVRIRWTD